MGKFHRIARFSCTVAPVVNLTAVLEPCWGSFVAMINGAATSGTDEFGRVLNVGDPS